MSDSKEEEKTDQEPASVVSETEQNALKLLVNQTSTYNANNIDNNPNADLKNNINLNNKKTKNKAIYPYRVARLDDICVSFVGLNFNSYPILDSVPEEYVMNIVNSIDLSKLVINEAAKHVECDKLWQRMARQRWENCKIELHGSSWKRLYLEKHLIELLESYYPSAPDSNINLNRLLESIKCSSSFIHSIKLNQLQLPSNLDLSQILPLFNNLSSLDITYKMLNIGMNYNPNQQGFGMNLNDALNISKYLQTTKTLSTLILSECLIDDETIHILMGGLEKNNTMTTLDLSYNKISDVGARRLSIFLQKQNNNVLRVLNLSNNEINDEGIRYIASTLKNNSHLLELNLSLNNINDLGAINLFECIAVSKSLQTLDVSCNHITNKSFEAFINLLRINNTLNTFNISGNPLMNANTTSASTTNSRPPSKYNNGANNLFAKQLENCLLNENITIINMNVLHIGLSKLEIKTLNKILKPRKVKAKQFRRKNVLNTDDQNR